MIANMLPEPLQQWKDERGSQSQTLSEGTSQVSETDGFTCSTAANFPWVKTDSWCVWNRICPRFSLFFFLPLCSPLFSVGCMEEALMWLSLSVVTAGPRGTRCSLDWLVVESHIYIYINKKNRDRQDGCWLRGGAQHGQQAQKDRGKPCSTKNTEEQLGFRRKWNMAFLSVKEFNERCDAGVSQRGNLMHISAASRACGHLFLWTLPNGQGKGFKCQCSSQCFDFNACLWQGFTGFQTKKKKRSIRTVNIRLCRVALKVLLPRLNDDQIPFL